MVDYLPIDLQKRWRPINSADSVKVSGRAADPHPSSFILHPLLDGTSDVLDSSLGARRAQEIVYAPAAAEVYFRVGGHFTDDFLYDSSKEK